ncbi:glycosyltransferase family 2 protein [Colwellia sp. TT2012]|uniref:glycosyltransferase family 2 protein n=1 Tax=Colwellia sp. TT2012 TaxID=1720342 RepID=UPI00070D74A8|nr:glycosyltransferase family 2 protein [Colwellia sp. TT2012]
MNLIKGNNIPKVTVCVVTYNQESYIAKCLQSIVDQITEFEFEVIVGDDCSTDSTVDIIRSFKERYPSLIKVIFRDANIGFSKNLIDLYKRSTGEYICHMDGDDYMLPTKIQKQSYALDTNKECVFCCHDVIQVSNTDFTLFDNYKPRKQGVYNLIDLYKQLPFFAHSSKMFRNNQDNEWWEQFNENAIDIEIHVEQAKRGHIFHIDDILGAYRVFTGMSNEKGKLNPILPNGTRRIFQKELTKGNRSILPYYAKAMLAYSYQSAVLGNADDAKKYARESFRLGYFSKKQFVFYILSFAPFLLVFFSKVRSSNQTRSV